MNYHPINVLLAALVMLLPLQAMPVETVQPEKIETSTQSMQAEKAETPVQTAQEEKVETPAQTAQEEKVETPAQTAQEEKAETPAQTAQPEKVEMPAQTVQPEKLDKLVQQCAMCHGRDGNSQTGSIPSFAGSSEEYFKFSLETYKNGNRASDLMKGLVDPLTSPDIDELAQYFRKQTFIAGAQDVNTDLAQKGARLHEKYCAKCHDISGNTDPDNYGILAGQWMPYLRKALESYLDGSRRTNPVMLAKLKRVQSEAGPEALEQLVNYYGGLK